MRTPEDPYLGMGWHVTPTPTIASYYIVCVCLLGGGRSQPNPHHCTWQLDDPNSDMP